MRGPGKHACLSVKESGDSNSAGFIAGTDGTLWAEYGIGANAAADAAAVAAMGAAVSDGSWEGQSFKMATGKFMIMGVEELPAGGHLAKASKLGGPAADGTAVVSVAFTGKAVLAGYNKESGAQALVNSTTGVLKGAAELQGMGY